MRRINCSLSLGILGMALVFVGCAHEEKANDQHSNIKPPAPVIKATDHKEPAGETASKVAEPGATKVECAVKDDVRILELRGHGGGCEFAYTKGGKEGVVASSENNGLSYCEKKFQTLKDRLKGAGFDCK